MAELFSIEIDTEEICTLMTAIQSHLTTARFNSVMASEFRRIPSPVKKILGEQVPKEYMIKAPAVRGAVKKATIKTGNGVGCIIPIKGSRGKLGAKGMFSALNGRYGWNINGPYTVKARIVKGALSALPFSMREYGGMPPFRNYAAPSLSNNVFTRSGQSRFPIEQVVGIGIPQMPTNRAKSAVESSIKDLMEGRLEHVYEMVLAGVIK